jgi:HEAT repeat protein
VRVRLLDLVEARKEKRLLPDVSALLLDSDDSVRERALRCLKTIGAPESAGPILAAAAKEEDEYLKVELAEALLELGDARGFGPMIDVIADGEAAQARRDAWEHLRAHAQVEVAFHPDRPMDQNVQAVADLRRWWKENEARLVATPSGVFAPKP